MQIVEVSKADIPVWTRLSAEYDRYVLELVPDISEWYVGSENSPDFDKYMKSKIRQKEAFMAVDVSNNCLGIIAVSKKNNRITFFAVSHKSDIASAGYILLTHALNLLDRSKEIVINEIKSNAPWILAQRELLQEFGFAYVEDCFENSVPLNSFKKSHD